VLLVDDREPPKIMELLAEFCVIPIEIKRLSTGDFVCDDVVIERKNIRDFFSSIIDKRVFEQKKRLIKEFPHHYILVSGSINDLDPKVHHATYGALARIMVNGVNVCFGLDDDGGLIYLILKILEKHGKIASLKSKPKKKNEKIINNDSGFVVGVIE
jgi:ERCC4-type nuclease